MSDRCLPVASASHRIGAHRGIRTHHWPVFKAGASADWATCAKGTLDRIRTDVASPRMRRCVHHRGYGAPSRTRTYSRRLRRPSTVLRPGRWMEQSLGVEPSSDVVGNEVSHHVTLRVWYLPLGSNQLPSAYRADAHPHELGRQNGQDGRTCTCGLRVPGSAVCC